MVLAKQEIGEIYIGDELQGSAYLGDVLVWEGGTPPEPCLFCYTGAEQCYVATKRGIYKLQVWGAQGGIRSSGYQCGKGGYSEGCICLTKDTVLYIYVGGAGTGGSNYSVGGWNGGGSACGTSRITTSGGGGTDIRIGGNTLCHRRIVAGGGGGGIDSTYNYPGGVGGGTCGTDGYSYNGGLPGDRGGRGGTQTSGGCPQSVTSWGAGICGSFGCGGGGTKQYITGGGGGRYGGGSGGPDGGGGGGSGYIYNSSTCGNAPSGYVHCSNYYLINAYTCAGNTTFPSTSGGTETGHAGCGYAIICFIC